MADKIKIPVPANLLDCLRDSIREHKIGAGQYYEVAYRPTAADCCCVVGHLSACANPTETIIPAGSINKVEELLRTAPNYVEPLSTLNDRAIRLWHTEHGTPDADWKHDYELPHLTLEQYEEVVEFVPFTASTPET